MTLKRIVTIGAYGFDSDGFFEALTRAGVDTFCDIRLRRGVRGPQCAFANAARLENRLGELGIGYVHRLDLAPTKALLDGQGEVDKKEGIARQARTMLSDSYLREYTQLRIDGLDSKALIQEIGPTRILALFCVEGHPGACHRSLVAEKLHRDLGVPVEHLLAPEFMSIR